MYVTHVAAGALSSACIVDGRLYEVRLALSDQNCNLQLATLLGRGRNSEALSFIVQWGFCCTSLKETSSSDAGADITDVSYEDAMESMVQLTGLVSFEADG